MRASAKTHVSLEEYLDMTFEHDCEYVRGEIVERSSPTFSHGDIQGILDSFFRPLRNVHSLYGAPEVRVRVHEDVVRIPDYCVLEGRPEEVPSWPALIAVEITSPDDRMNHVLEKLSDYRRWGVRHVWLVQTSLKTLYIYDGSLIETAAFEVPEYQLRIEVADIFA